MAMATGKPASVAPPGMPLVAAAPVAATVTKAVTVPAPATPAAPPRMELPSADADYLEQAQKIYPKVSIRLGESGRVLLQVLIGVDGAAHKVEIKQSSGFERLDQAAVRFAQQTRYRPGKKDGQPEAMWYALPIPFELK
jgi:protein TonB